MCGCYLHLICGKHAFGVLTKNFFQLNGINYIHPLLKINSTYINNNQNKVNSLKHKQIYQIRVHHLFSSGYSIHFFSVILRLSPVTHRFHFCAWLRDRMSIFLLPTKCLSPIYLAAWKYHISTHIYLLYCQATTHPQQ